MYNLKYGPKLLIRLDIRIVVWDSIRIGSDMLSIPGVSNNCCFEAKLFAECVMWKEELKKQPLYALSQSLIVLYDTTF